MNRVAVGCALVVGSFTLLLIVTMLSRAGVRAPWEFFGTAIDGVLGCRSTILKTVISPDSSYVASVSVMDCWDSVIGVGLGTKGDPAATSILGVTNRGPEESEVDVRWLDNRTLRVTYSGRPEMVYYKGAHEWQGVHVVYVQAPPKN